MTEQDMSSNLPGDHSEFPVDKATATDGKNTIPEGGLVSLDAFLASTEETAVTFASTFTALDVQQRMQMLLALDNAVASEEDAFDEAARKEIVDLFAALESEEAQQRTAAATMTLPAGSRTLAERHDVLERRAGDDDELEVVELDEAAGTQAQGNFAALFSSAPLRGKRSDTSADSPTSASASSSSIQEEELVDAHDGVTSHQRRAPQPRLRLRQTVFDNFFGEDVADDGVSMTVRSTADSGTPDAAAAGECLTSRKWENVEPPSLDDFLSVHDDVASSGRSNEGDKNGIVPSDASSISAESTTQNHHHQHQDPSVGQRCDDKSGELCSDEEEEELALPGLEGADQECAADATGTDVPELSAPTDVAAALREVVEDDDDYVRPFALDPLFDYDGDLLGRALANNRPLRDARLGDS